MADGHPDHAGRGPDDGGAAVKCRPTGRRAGFTLTEMVVVMWAMGIALVLGAQLIVAGFRAGGIGEAADARTTRRGALARQFRGDVARAEAAPDTLGDAAAGPDRLLLQLPGGTVVTYEWTDGGLVRTERAGDKEARRPLPLGADRVRVEFPRPKDGLVTLRIIETRQHAPDRTADVSAALGGDLR